MPPSGIRSCLQIGVLMRVMHAPVHARGERGRARTSRKRRRQAQSGIRRPGYPYGTTELRVTIPDDVAERLASEAAERGTSAEDLARRRRTRPRARCRASKDPSPTEAWSRTACGPTDAAELAYLRDVETEQLLARDRPPKRTLAVGDKAVHRDAHRVDQHRSERIAAARHRMIAVKLSVLPSRRATLIKLAAQLGPVRTSGRARVQRSWAGPVFGNDA
jgi:hypothetical protein